MKELLQNEIQSRVGPFEDCLPTLNCKYQLLITVGEGAFGKVKLARHIRTKKLYAIKILKKHCNYSAFESFLKEITTLKKFSKEKLAPKVFDFDFTGELFKYGRCYNVAFYATEFIFPGEIYRLIESNQLLTFPVLVHLYKQLLLNLEKLKKVGILHCDLKMENLLLDEKFNVSLCDFGTVREMQDFQLEGCIGTQEYSAPELETLRGRRPPPGFDPLKLEIFSIGVIMHVLVFRKFPRFDRKNGHSLNDKDEIVDERIKNFVDNHLKKILDHDFRRRPGFDEVKKFVFGLECDNSKAELLQLINKFQEDSSERILANLSKTIKKISMKRKVFGLCSNKKHNEKITEFYNQKEIQRFLRDHGSEISDLGSMKTSRDSFVSVESRSSNDHLY